MARTVESTVKGRPFALIGVPSSAGARRAGQEGAPAALRRAGLAQRLSDKGLDVADHGDLQAVAFRPDDEHPRRQNLEPVRAVAQRTATAVDRALDEGRAPVVLGGDCSLSLGVIAGVLAHHDRVGLVYFDGDVDLNTPETTPSGAFDGMVLAHLLGRGAPELTGLGPRRPMLAEEDVVLFGYDVTTGWIDPPEIEALERSHMTRFPLDRVRADARGAAMEALALLEGRVDALVVHFDLDVTNLPAVDVPHPNGLDPATAFAALGVLAGAPSCVAVVVTELQPELDPGGLHALRLVEGLAEALAAGEGV